MLEVVRVPALRDNYVWLAHDPNTGTTAVVDPAERKPVEAALEERGWSLSVVLNTHHHADHVGANLALAARHGATIVGPRADRSRIPGIGVEVGTGDTVQIGESTGRVYDVPGHTRGHIAYHFEDSNAVFVGDTLFAGGCGRMFEGTPEQFWRSLALLRALPASTWVYCAHEYTEATLRFALSVEPGNAELMARFAEVQAARARGEATVPSVLGVEAATNPFLRCDRATVAEAVGLPPSEPAAVFAAVRAAKDGFR